MNTSRSSQNIWWKYRVLDEISRNENISQRDIARSLGIALGRTNQIVKRLVRKGLIKTNQVNAKRVAYYLTPKGFSEKLQLVVRYTRLTVSLFRCVREITNKQLLALQERHDARTVALVGTGELAEAVYLSIMEVGMELRGVYDLRQSRRQWFGQTVHRLGDAPDEEADIVVITEMEGLGEHQQAALALGRRVVELRALLSDRLAEFAGRVAGEDPALAGLTEGR